MNHNTSQPQPSIWPWLHLSPLLLYILWLLATPDREFPRESIDIALMVVPVLSLCILFPPWLQWLSTRIPKDPAGRVFWVFGCLVKYSPLIFTIWFLAQVMEMTKNDPYLTPTSPGDYVVTYIGVWLLCEWAAYCWKWMMR